MKSENKLLMGAALGAALVLLTGAVASYNRYVGVFVGDASGMTNLPTAKAAAGAVSADRIAGALTNFPTAVSLTNDYNLFVGTFTGTSELTNFPKAVNITNVGNAFAGAFTGNGAGLTNVPVSALSSTSNAWTGTFAGDGAGLTNITTSSTNAELATVAITATNWVGAASKAEATNCTVTSSLAVNGASDGITVAVRRFDGQTNDVFQVQATAGNARLFGVQSNGVAVAPTFKCTGSNGVVLVCPDGGTWVLRVADDGSVTAVTNASGL